MKNERKLGNKGFSLVELIVVIAIMVVLVAVLAPVFTRYIERSRRATDVQNANSIATAVITDAASDELTTDSGIAKPDNVKSIKSEPKAQGKAHKGNSFWYVFNPDSNTCQVYIANDGGTASVGLDLTNETNAKTYTDATGSDDGSGAGTTTSP
jgi:prepilin-type N-terminal cleavage/methylation domain-containing protein